jgi:predicted  nucleic acid-binding Zn ribbon protein
MYVVAVRLPQRYGCEEETIDAFQSWIGNLRDNGQILGSEFVVARNKSELVIHFFLPTPDALDSRYDNPGYTRNRAELLQAGGEQVIRTTRRLAVVPLPRVLSSSRTS